MPSTTVSARLTLIVLPTSYTPGVRSRFMPRESWLLMTWTESEGLATKNCDSGIDRPGVGPFSHETPEELVVASGTNTLYLPAASTYR